MKTAGILIAVIGIALIMAGIRNEIEIGLKVIAIGSALGLAMVDVRYAVRRIISRIYLADAVIELGIVLVWGLTLL